MEKIIDKALFLGLKRYSLYNSILDVIKELSVEATGFDIREEIYPSYFKIHAQMFRFTNNIRSHWEKIMFQKINSIILKKIETYDPDLVLVYNSEYLLPETCSEIKKRAKMIFFMGDSPYYTHINNYYLACLGYADLILAPDTFWLGQLNTLGLHNTSFFCPDIDSKSYFIIEDPGQLSSIPEHEILYVGGCYVDSWGYKKALLMSRFTSFDFKFYGNSKWERWFRFFPELKNHFIESTFISTSELNRMFNRVKLVPVDGNPAILNGFHLRAYEALGAGALPLIEYRRDVDEKLFNGCNVNLPVIKDYSKASSVAEYYLKNEKERKETVLALRNHIAKNFNKEINAQRLSEWLNKKPRLI